MEFTGKNVLITGGSRGIGEMIAEGFVANGVRTYISARKADACDATAERLGHRLRVQRADVAGHLRQMFLAARFPHQPRLPPLAVQDQRARYAYGQRHRHARLRIQRQGGFHLGGKLIGQEQEPAAAERQIIRHRLHVLVLPPAVQGGQEIVAAERRRTAQMEIRIQHQTLSREREQDVETALRGAARGALEQERIASWEGPIQGQGQTGIVGDRMTALAFLCWPHDRDAAKAALSPAP